MLELNIRNPQVSLENEEGTVEFQPSVVSAGAVAEMIDDMGFEAALKNTASTPSKKSKYWITFFPTKSV